MDIFIGIDPSINSTGVCIQQFDNGVSIKENFYIVVPNSITKRAKNVADSLDCFSYVIYHKEDLSIYKGNNHWEEYYKTCNMINIVDSVDSIITTYLSEHAQNASNIYIVQEGISYGSSIRTKSVFDLAGLNYLIRERFINKENIVFYIATPAEVKKFATGRGNANKAMMKMFFSKVHEDLTIIPKFDDIADAYFMSNYACVLMKNDLE